VYYSQTEKLLLLLIPLSPQADLRMVFLAGYHQKVVTEQREEADRLLDGCRHHHQKPFSQWSEEAEVGKSDKSGYTRVP